VAALGAKQLFLVMVMQDTESGFIGVQPGCFPEEGTGFMQAETNLSVGEYESLKPCFKTAGYIPMNVKAGTVMLHQVSVFQVHPGSS
jgi:hypothetical protein